jgi:hypothetical protein
MRQRKTGKNNRKSVGVPASEEMERVRQIVQTAPSAEGPDPTLRLQYSKEMRCLLPLPRDSTEVPEPRLILEPVCLLWQPETRRS